MIRPDVSKEEVSQFIKDNGNLDIVLDLKDANQNRDAKRFGKLIRTIEDHLHAVTIIEASLEEWEECGCGDCALWKDQYNEKLIWPYRV